MGDCPVEFLVLYTPGTFVSFAEELAALGPLDLDDESDLERVAPVFESYGIEMVGPPPEG